jgi:tetratricopeptide (TPR) repeat protein
MRKWPRWTALAIAGLIPQAGCALWETGNLLSPSSGAVSASVAGNEAALPPEKAAQACLATAQALERQGHEAEAIAEYERARQYNPRASVSRRLAVLYDRQGNFEKASAEYSLALKAQPKDADLLNDVGYSYYACGDCAEAEKRLRQALEVDAGNQRAWVNLGLVLGQLQRYDESYQAFTKALPVAEAHYNMGVILAQQGKQEQAKEAFREALTLQPDLKQARAILDVLEKPARTASGQPAEPEKGPRNSAAAQVTRG